MIWEISFSAPIKGRKKSHRNQCRHNIDSGGMLMFGIGGPSSGLCLILHGTYHEEAD